MMNEPITRYLAEKDAIYGEASSLVAIGQGHAGNRPDHGDCRSGCSQARFHRNQPFKAP